MSATRGASRAGLCLGVALVAAPLGCVHSTDRVDGVAVGRSLKPEGATAPVQFKFDSLDSREVSTGAVLGKPTVITFVTTWDLSSQAQIDFLVPMAKRSGSSSNYLMVALQDAADRELVEVYAEHLGVTFPVAMADKDALAQLGSFGELNAVPTTVILDRAARIVWRHVGLARPEDIRAGLSGL